MSNNNNNNNFEGRNTHERGRQRRKTRSPLLTCSSVKSGGWSFGRNHRFRPLHARSNSEQHIAAACIRAVLKPLFGDFFPMWSRVPEFAGRTRLCTPNPHERITRMLWRFPQVWTRRRVWPPGWWNNNKRRHTNTVSPIGNQAGLLVGHTQMMLSAELGLFPRDREGSSQSGWKPKIGLRGSAAADACPDPRPRAGCF